METLEEREQRVLGEYIEHRDKMRELQKELDEIDAAKSADYQRDVLGKCFIRYYEDEELEVSYMTLMRVEEFDKQGRAKGTEITVSNSGRINIEHCLNIWCADKDYDGEREKPFPADIFAKLADVLAEDIKLRLDEFIKDLDGWKTKRQSLIMNCWTRIQQVLSSTGLKLKPFEMEE